MKLIMTGASISIGAGLCWGDPTEEEQITNSRGFVTELRQLITAYFSNQNVNCESPVYDNFASQLEQLNERIETCKQNNEIYLNGFNYPDDASEENVTLEHEQEIAKSLIEARQCDIVIGALADETIKRMLNETGVNINLLRMALKHKKPSICSFILEKQNTMLLQNTEDLQLDWVNKVYDLAEKHPNRAFLGVLESSLTFKRLPGVRESFEGVKQSVLKKRKKMDRHIERMKERRLTEPNWRVKQIAYLKERRRNLALKKQDNQTVKIREKYNREFKDARKKRRRDKIQKEKMQTEPQNNASEFNVPAFNQMNTVQNNNWYQNINNQMNNISMNNVMNQYSFMPTAQQNTVTVFNVPAFNQTNTVQNTVLMNQGNPMFIPMNLVPMNQGNPYADTNGATK